MERKEGPPAIQVSCDNHGNIGVTRDLNAAFQMSSDHLYRHPECEDFLDDNGVRQKHVHIADTSGNVWR